MTRSLPTPQVGWLAALAAPDRCSIIAGDANSLALGDPEPPDWARLPAHLGVRYLQPDHPGQAPVADRSALALLRRAGFVDAAAVHGDLAPTVPAAGFPDAEFVPFRCDHVLLSPALAPGLTTYRVLDDDRTAHASDHLPVVVELADGVAVA
ncbi:hypothetical protein [Pseudonocardia alni]|uniref:hypothetical protein n=1 Tax=Pseudonocardia alni TaxID=33907 RepID=UPI0033F53C85